MNRMLKLFLVTSVVVLVGCGDDDCCVIADASIDADPTLREEVASIAATPNRDVDLLFVVDDSPTMLDKQTSLTNAFPTFVNVLSGTPGGFPNIHLGVITSDLGTRGAEDAMPGPTIGAGQGSCGGTGKAGRLQTNNTPLLTGNFISDIEVGGVRTKNYTGSLAEVFSAIASVGASGCGFEQPIEAAKLALDGNPSNAGFLRASANLVVIFLTDEDDCSVAHNALMSADTALLGPLQSFRCTRYGITCDQGGLTPDEMNLVGVKSGCRSNESSPYLTKIDDYVTFFQGLKPNPSMLMVAALAAPPMPVNVELRAPPAGGSAIPTLIESCQYVAGTFIATGDPAVRLAQLVGKLAHNAFESVCAENLTGPVTTIANKVRSMVGDTCLTRTIAMPPDCVVTEQSSAGTKNLRACGGSQTNDCYSFIEDPVGCTSFDRLRVDILRSAPPPADAVITVRCVVP